MHEHRYAKAGPRLDETRGGGWLNGIDHLEVDAGHPPDVPAQRTLLVRCLLPVPADLGSADLEVQGGVRADPAVNPVRVQWAVVASGLAAARDTGLVTAQDAEAFCALPDPETLLVVRTSSSGDFSGYRLVVVEPDRYEFDPRLAAADFGFKVDCPTDFDCPVPAPCPPERLPEPTIDYLNRDFTGLRQLLLDRLSLVLPRWADRNVADLGVTLVELFAYLGDHLAYAQDAVSAEAYLGTARRRVSVARHARLLDYRMHNGAASRTWLVVEADEAADGTTLVRGTEVHAADGSVVFHTLHDLTVRASRSAIDFYTWGEPDSCLPRGATRATLRGTCSELDLHAGDVLLLEEVLDGDGAAAGADRSHRWAVRLVADPRDRRDPLTGADLVDVAWRAEDELPFPLCLRLFPRGRCEEPLGASVARGNVVLVEHGRLVGPEPLVPEQVPDRGDYRPTVDQPGLAHAVPYDHDRARAAPAVDALLARPEEAVPQVVRLSDGRDDWTVRPDLLGSDRFEPEFVVEMEDDGRAHLRFGDDVLGRRPLSGDSFRVSYRVGGGRAGNVGPDVLTVLATQVPGLWVRNPLPAQGGEDPEPVEQVRQWAPQAFRVQQRAVTDADYGTVAGRHPQVQRAAATRRWTGSWYTEFVTVDRRRGDPVDPGFRSELAAFLEPFRMAGLDVAVDAPVAVSLDIVLTVCVVEGHFRAGVRRALVDRFSAGDLPGGGRGFFHPDNFTFGQPVFLSEVVAAVMSVDGVRWVETEEGPGSPNRFRRWGRPAAGERTSGRISMDRLEIARCDSDPNEPENGRIEFVMVGGL
ncbi:putative baseplate assembly protein [Geodermatophilus aquaeductus]|nr:putative baseplate assembly protein [Geodermatophilus aquaeductus]